MNYEINTENLTEEEMQELERIVEKAKRNPMYGKRYYYLTSIGRTDLDKWSDNGVDMDRFNIGNCFQTIEEAEFRSEELEVEAELKRCMKKYNSRDFNILDNNVKKWFFACNLEYKSLIYYYQDAHIYGKIAFETREITERVVKEVGEERILKYFFGVKYENVV